VTSNQLISLIDDHPSLCVLLGTLIGAATGLVGSLSGILIGKRSEERRAIAELAVKAAIEEYSLLLQNAPRPTSIYPMGQWILAMKKFMWRSGVSP